MLTRLLAPEMFGLMAVAQALLAGITLLTDFGINQSIIQHKRGEDADFFNAAWTLKIVRGFGIAIVLALIALGLFGTQQTGVLSSSSVYSNAELPPIIIALTLSVIFGGYISTNLAVANRNLLLARITLIEFGCQIIALITMIILAYLYQSIWALVVGNIFSAFLRVFFSHTLIPGTRNKWHWDPPIIKEIFNFGKWILLATALTYIGGEGLRLIQGALVPAETLGFISIAAIFAWAPGQIVHKLSGSVVFPAFSKIFRETPEKLGASIKHFQSKMLMLVVPVFLILSLISPALIDFLYDDRYLVVGEYIRLMALSSAIGVLPIYYQNAYLSTGNSKKHFQISVFSTFTRISGTVLGFYYFDVHGMFVGLGIGGLLNYSLIGYLISGKNWSAAKADGIAICAILTAFGIALM